MSPDINESFEHFTVVSVKDKKEGPDDKIGKIRFGLLTIKNVGKNIVEEIIKERKKNGRFKDLEDFVNRVKGKDLNKKSLESLIKCGAMDDFGDRVRLLFNLEKILLFVKQNRDNENNGQGDLLGMLSNPYKAVLSLDDVEDGSEISQKEKLSWEKELLGLYVSDHPFIKFLKPLGDKTISLMKLNKKTDNSNDPIITAGIISKIKKIITKKGDAMLFVKIEDNTSNIEVLVFPRLLEENKDLWEEERAIAIRGELTDKDGIPKLIANTASELNIESVNMVISRLNNFSDKGNKFYYKKKKPEVDEYAGGGVSRFMDVRMPQSIKKDTLVKLKDVFSRYSGDIKVRFIVENGVGRRIVDTSFSVSTEKLNEIKSDVRDIIGGNAV